MDLENYFKINFALLQFHKYSLTEIENLIPWERDIYIAMLQQHLEDELREEGAREKITVVKGSKINKKSFTKTIGTNTLERRIGNNEKKITSLKKILQFKKTNIGDNLRDIGQDSENPKNNPLGSLKKDLVLY